MSEAHPLNIATENSRTRPRLFVQGALHDGRDVILDTTQTHYIRNVLRQDVGATLRLFNGVSGEFLTRIIQADKKQVVVQVVQCLRPPAAPTPRRVLIFSLVKKDALDTILVKATELGATDIQPVLTARSVVRALNADRATDQVREATEQCERLDPAIVHPLRPLSQALEVWAGQMPVFGACETLAGDILSVPSCTGDAALVVGPEGGWTPAEIDLLAAHAGVTPVSLGATILRADTACLVGLTLLAVGQGKGSAQ
ncbi:MAG: RsmE family RNA methyltransferase [Pseudomonadota bacterium]